MIALGALIIDSILDSAEDWTGPITGGMGFWSALWQWSVIFAGTSAIGTRAHAYLVMNAEEPL